jgi:hypothetical protein
MSTACVTSAAQRRPAGRAPGRLAAGGVDDDALLEVTASNGDGECCRSRNVRRAKKSDTIEESYPDSPVRTENQMGE